MNKESFYAVVDLIKGDPVFQRKGKKPQQPVAHQVALVLNRLGTTGNGSSVGATAQKFGYSVGSVEKFTERVLTALYNLANEYYIYIGLTVKNGKTSLGGSGIGTGSLAALDSSTGQTPSLWAEVLVRAF